MAEAIDSEGNPIIKIQVGNPQGAEFEELPVDPKALFTILPQDLLDRLKVPARVKEARQAPDGSREPVQIGDVRIRACGHLGRYSNKGRTA